MRYVEIEVRPGTTGVRVAASPKTDPANTEFHFFSSIHEAAHWIVEAFSEPREPVTNPEKKET